MMSHIEGHAMNIDSIHLTSLFKHAIEGIILTNGDGRIVLINPAAQMIFGYKENEMIGHPVEILIPERLKMNHTQLRTGFYEHPQHRSMVQGHELCGKRKDGSEVPVEVSLSFYKQEKELFVIAFIVDITHRKKIEYLSEALDKEKELNEIKSRFVAMASHEFRTPLSTILSSASLMSKYHLTDDQDKRDRHINRIKDAVKQLNDLLEDFLSLDKLDEGKVQVVPEPVELNEFLEEVVEEMKAFTRNGQQIIVSCESNGVFKSDKKLLKSILINLLSNASKFSAEGAAIWVKAEHRNNKLTLSIKDEGIGIAEEDLPYMFSSFYRGRNAVNIQGTGLGLHLVKRYLELMNGTVSLESKLHEGTTISLELPD
jgi:PAS domain S-box-containing protein